MLGFIIFLLVVGLIGGFVARAVLPGRDALSLAGTIFLGAIGSFVGGFLGYVLFREDGSDGYLQASGIVGSIVGSIIALIVYRMANGRSISA
ncbi:MAG: GlsB/YeaQ/YmgE family stress response membrane protein [Ilumatobacteraceae bacterium]